MTPRRGQLATAVGCGLLVVALATIARVGKPAWPGSQQEYLGRRIDSAISRSYRAGRELWSKGDSASLMRAIVLFQEALDLDPTYAEAYAGRGAAYLALACGGFLLTEDAFPKAKAAALTALQLDSRLIEPHFTLGTYYRYYEGDKVRAEKEFQLGIQSPRSHSCQPSVRSGSR